MAMMGTMNKETKKKNYRRGLLVPFSRNSSSSVIGKSQHGVCSMISSSSSSMIYSSLFLIIVAVVSSARPCHSMSPIPMIPSSSSSEVSFFHSKKKMKKINNKNHRGSQTQFWMDIPRGGEIGDVSSNSSGEKITESAKETIDAFVDLVSSNRNGGGTANVIGTMIDSALKGLVSYMKEGGKTDTLLLLFTTALNTPLCKAVGTSPILGYLLLGLLFGPNGYSLIKDVHTTELLADFGIIFFLFEMGLHLDFNTLLSMRKDVFGLGGSQFVVTATVIALICKFAIKGGLSTAAQIVLGGGLALSSSAFVLQLLKDKDQMNTRFGRSSFGVLLLQDLAVVPLLVITPLLAGGGDGGSSLTDALGSAGIKAVIAISTIAIIGKFALKPFFNVVENTDSQEAFVGAILSTVLGFSFLTEGLGLSNTLGAFLAGVLLSETKHRRKIEKEVAPFRGILVGLFFFSVGFEIDVQLIRSKPGLIASIVLGIACLKTIIAGLLGWSPMIGGLNKGTALRLGLILCQGGEFAFVAFRLARSCGIFTDEMTKLMLTCVSLTMGLTPFLDDFGANVSTKLDPPLERLQEKIVHTSRRTKNKGSKVLSRLKKEL